MGKLVVELGLLVLCAGALLVAAIVRFVIYSGSPEVIRAMPVFATVALFALCAGGFLGSSNGLVKGGTAAGLVTVTGYWIHAVVRQQRNRPVGPAPQPTLQAQAPDPSPPAKKKRKFVIVRDDGAEPT